MSKNATVEAQIGQAWNHHREGRSADAIAAFEKILGTIPNNVDALYGIGLAQKALGREADAVESFQKAYELGEEMLRAIRSQVGGDENVNALQTSEDDRYMMLGRMTKQRLAELGVTVS